MVTQKATPVDCAVVRAMNSHDAVTLADLEGGRTFQVVEYATDECRQTLADIEEGTRLSVSLEPIRSRADVWRARTVEADAGSKTANGAA